LTDLPKKIEIREEGPREGFQIEQNPIETTRKIELINALSKTGLKNIQIVSFVDPKKVPGMADAADVVAGITLEPGITYTGLWLNDQGFKQAVATNRLEITGYISLSGSAAFLKRNQNRSSEEQITAQHTSLELYKNNDIDVEKALIMAAFGCNFQGEVSVEHVLSLTAQIQRIADEHDISLKQLALADTMGWATPLSIKHVVGALQNKFPSLEILLHLHDTRGMGIANAFAGLEMGIRHFDASVAGLGGCPFAGNAAAAGNVCTEDLVFMCDEMGIETGIDLEALADCARLAEDIVGRPLPGSMMKGGSLHKLRQTINVSA
jgi:hydroxymethylglutaryl-CoA lyase